MNVLARLGPTADDRLLVGPETLDDAAVLRAGGDQAIVFTADFITPIVDEPRDWGRIAAANSFSDVFAMGGQTLGALNLLCWPKNLPDDLLHEVLAGAAEAAREAGCSIVGGHSMRDKEPKFGLAVIGTVHPDRILRNQGAQAGDRLYLTKPLGTGILATAIKADATTESQAAAAVQSMSALNRVASEAAVASGVRAMTDVTGFGLIGHLVEMLGGSERLGVHLSFSSLPLLPGTVEHVEKKRIPGGTGRNRAVYAAGVYFSDKLARPDADIASPVLYDPQTSGGLLIAVPPESVELFVREAAGRGVTAHEIGLFDGNGRIEVVA